MTFKGLSCLAVALAAAAACAERFPVEPMTFYRADKPQDIQFYDADGRTLFLGTYPNAKLVASPMDAATANVRLTPVEIDHDGVPIDDPAFWCEQSRVELNTGDHLRVKPRGYAVSIFLPAVYDYAATKDPSDTRKKVWPGEIFHECMSRLWYDRDMREIARCNSNHLGAGAAPTNAVYVRFIVPWSMYDNFRNQRLFRPYWNEKHRFCGKRGMKDSEIFKAMPKPEWHPGEIVLDPRPDCRELYAAAELVRETKTVTGKVLPVVSSPTRNAAFHIYLGRKAAERAGFFKDADLVKKLDGSDGYAIRRKGRDVYAFGALPLGTIYASMKLLENLTDFFWWRPERDCGLSFTPQKAIDFASAKDCDDRPVFHHRTFYVGCCPCLYEFDDWALHHGLKRHYRPERPFSADSYHAKCRGFVCSIGDNFLGLATHGNEKREEFWGMVNGKRDVGATDGQPCYSNPEVVKATVANVNRILDDAPEEWDHFDFAYSDSWQCCECDECLKPIKLPQGGELACHSRAGKVGNDSTFRSTRTFMVANEVAKAVTARFPDKPTMMFAYIYTAAPPEVKLHPSIRVNYATYASASMRFSSMEQNTGEDDWPGRTARWCEREPQAMGMYEYYFTAAPGMYAEVAAANLRQMADVGGTYSVHTESSLDGKDEKGAVGRRGHLWDVNAMEQVLIASLFWNPYQNVGKMRADFLRRVYGPGAKDMAGYYLLFRPHWFDRGFKTWMSCHTPMPDVYTEFIIKPQIEAKTYELFESALKKAPSPAAKMHLERKIAVYKEMRRATGRVDIPHVPEMATEWKVPNSPQWNKAYTLKDFRDALPDPTDPEQMTCDLRGTPPPLSKTKTRVDFACDRRYLYWRVAQDKRGGFTELDFAIGKYMDLHRFFTTGKERIETGRIPMAAIRSDPSNVISYIVRRFDAKGNCSFGRGVDNKTRAYPGESGDSLSKLCPAVDSVFDPSDDPKFGKNAKPPMTFPDPELENSPLLEQFQCRPGLGGQNMRRVRGVPVFDTGFGYCHIKGIADVRPGDVYEVTGDRWIYGGYAPFVVDFLDEKGAKISDGSFSPQQGPFSFRVTCPPGTKSFRMTCYSSYVKAFKIEKVAK